MEHGNNIDMMTLSWFVPEIRESLQHVAHALDELRANPHGQDAIKRARLHLHQTHGALQVAGISGVALLTEEAEHVISAFEDGVLEADESSIDVLKMVMRAITEYLEDMQASGTSIPVLVLYPYYRDLVGLRKAVDLDRALPASVRAMISDAPDREERAKSAARGFERALPALIRGENVVAAIDGLHESMGRMLRNQPHVGARLFYWLSYALLDGLKHGALKVDLATRRAVGRINIQNRHLFTGQSDVPPQFIKELLIILAQAAARPSWKRSSVTSIWPAWCRPTTSVAAMAWLIRRPSVSPARRWCWCIAPGRNWRAARRPRSLPSSRLLDI